MPYAVATGCPGTVRPLPPLPPSSRPRLLDLRARLDALAAEIVEFWAQYGSDLERGGFFGKLDRRGLPTTPEEKGAVQHARHTWTWSMWHERREPSERARSMARRGRDFLLRHFRDPADEQYYFLTDRTGSVVEPKKQLYAQAFAVFGLAQYGRVFGEAEALKAAMACFDAIESRFRDFAYRGYDQSVDPGWLSSSAAKDTNTHIHLLEAYTGLLDASGSERVRARLAELVEVVAHRMRQPEGYIHQEFRRDWSPVGERIVSYGHDLETAWLLLDAMRALDAMDETVVDAALAIAMTSASAGFDPERGGYFLAGRAGGAVTQTEKVWWVQAEALAGLFWLFRLTGEVIFLDRMDSTLRWIEQRQRDPEHGEWFWGILADGRLGPVGDGKGNPWKTAYHNLRATTFVGGWVGDILTDGFSLGS